MAENQDGQEKTNEPTAKRLNEARRKGQTPRSKELQTMAVTLVGSASLLLLGSSFADGVGDIFNANFTLTRADLFDTGTLIRHLGSAIRSALLMLLPFFAIAMAVALLASVALGGFNVSTESMTPKFSKMNPLKGLKRIFSPNGLMELGKALAKFLLIAGATVLLIWSWWGDLLRLANKEALVSIVEGLTLVGWSSLLLSSTLIFLALVDVPFQLWNHKRQLKMTQQEVRDEHKETEGRPEVKGRIRQLQREMARRRMMEEVPKADVIVTNPTHYAVALKYDQTKMNAPLLVAKGSDLVAANIRRVGEEHAVPVVEAPVLARAIYFNTELNESIPTGLYLAVAQLLAYVFQLQAYEKGSGEVPVRPEDFPVPEDLQHD